MISDSPNSPDGTVAASTKEPLISELDYAALRDQLDETREEISRIDNKASTLLAGTSVAGGVILAGFIAGNLQLGAMPLPAVAAAVLAAAATIAGLGAVGATLFPRCGTPEPGHARYFAEVASYPTTAALATALVEDSKAGDRLLHQLLGLSKSVARKYSILRRGFALLGCGLVLGVLTTVLAAWLP